MATLASLVQGESFSITFSLPVDYDMNRIKSIKIYVGGIIFPHAVIDRTVRCELSSNDTGLMIGLQKIVFWIDGFVYGVRKLKAGDLNVLSTTGAANNEAVNAGDNLMIVLNITETVIEVTDVLFNYLKGYSSYQLWALQPENIGKTYEQFEAWEQQPATDAAASFTISENLRVITEDGRVVAEWLRVTAENARDIAEGLRDSAEVARLAAEGLRDTAEGERIIAEGARVTAEGLRVIALATAVENQQLSASDFTKLANLPTDLANRPAAVAGIYPVTALPEQEALYAYGVQYDLASSSPVLLRVGNRSFHASLPIQSKMRGCLLLDNGTVNYYLYPTNWAFKEDGVTASNLSGTDGQVMVETPRYFRKFDYPTPTTYRCMISEYPLAGYIEVKKQYTSAYEATIQRSNLKLASVVNLTTDYRGGNNDATKDALANTQLGKPATSKTIIEFRTYARNRNAGATAEWNQLSYDNYKSVVWLCYIEYANLNVQLPVAAKDANGYATGGIGNGVTIADSAKWNTFNGYYPIINCGASNALGNNSGEVSVVVTDFQGAGVPQTFTVPRYRGIEHLFGHIWKFTDGIMVDVKIDAEGGTSTVYTTLLPANFANTITANYVSKGLESRVEGWAKTMLLGTTGELMATTVGGGSTTYWCDYKYCNVASSSLRCVLFGGNALHATNAGLGYSYTANAFSYAAAIFGSRLCFIPA